MPSAPLRVAPASYPDRNPRAWAAFVSVAGAMRLLEAPPVFNADCCACLRGRAHTPAEHEAILRRNLAASVA